jgi:hypothetical protein
MPVTVTDAQAAQIRKELEEAQRNKQSLQAIQDIWNDPSLGNEAKALWKKKYPDSAIEGFDQEQKLTGIVSKFEDDRKKEKEEAELTRRTDAAKAARRATQERHGFTDDAMTRLDSLMKERDIFDYEAGGLLLASREPKPSNGDADHGAHFWDHEKQKGFAEIARDPERWGFDEIVKAVRADDTQRRNRF